MTRLLETVLSNSAVSRLTDALHTRPRCQRVYMALLANRRELVRFAKFATVGVIGTVVDFTVLNVLILPEPGASEETTTTTISRPKITLPPIITISEGMAKTIETARSQGTDIVFSKLRAGVTRVRTTAKTILTNQPLMTQTAVALFLIMIVLAGIRKIMTML